MFDVFSDQFFSALRDLFVAGVVYFAYKTARDAAENSTAISAVWKSLLWCGGLAAFAAATLGAPSCEESGDPLRGGCEAYADDGFDPTTEQRLARFSYFFILLFVPAVIGCLDRNPVRAETNQKWRKDLHDED